MKTTMLRPLKLKLAVLLALALPLSAQEKDLAAKLDSLLRHPGSYSQICDAMTSSFPAPIPAFRSIMHGEAGFSEKNLEFIKKNRAAILKAVAAKLEKLDPAKAPTPQPPDPSVKKDADGNFEADADPVGTDPSTFSTLLLTIIEETDGAEALGALLAFEEKYNTLLTAAEKDDKAPIPQADGDGAGVFANNITKEDEDYDAMTPERKAEVERKQELFRAQAVHRDILAVCVRLMRKAGYDPMLSSPLEKTYGKLLKEKWGTDEQLSKYKKAADIPEEERESIKFDPIHKVAYMTWLPVEMPYTPETRQQIIELTKAFIASRKAK